ncbi:MAG TPA: NnrU family protein [Candidatus Polarisedimenticolia bacterium]|nr:NnrU family protein [Candidatus Polarisedimenticolia bacterium]
MDTEAAIFMWWVLFGGTHVVGSSVPVRSRLIRRLGLPGFKGVYTLVAFATFIPLCYVYLTDKHAGAVLFEPGEAMRWLAQAVMLLAFLFVGQGLATPHPMTTQAELTGSFPDQARGVQRITRHPENLGFGLFGVAHCLANPTVGDWLFFGGFAVYALVSAAHQDRRTLASGPPAVRAFQQQTSFWPFAAILAGRQRVVIRELRMNALWISATLFLVVRIFHGRIFGGFGG